MLSRNSGYGHVKVGEAALVSVSGCIENPCRWNGWCAPVVLVTVSCSVSPIFAYRVEPRCGALVYGGATSWVPNTPSMPSRGPTVPSWMFWLESPGLGG